MESEQNNLHSCIRPDSPVEVDLTPKLPNSREANYEHSQSHNLSTQSREEGTHPKEHCHGDPDCESIKKEQLLKKSSSPEDSDVCLDSHTSFNAPGSVVDTGISEHRDISTLAKNNLSTCNKKGKRKNSRATVSDSQRGGEQEKKTDYNSISLSLGFGSCKNHLSEDKQNTESKFVFSEPQNTSGSGNNYSDLRAKSYDSLLRECHSSNNDVYKNKFGEYDEKEKVGAVGLSSQHKQDFSLDGRQSEYDQAATLTLQLNEVNHLSSEDFSRDWHSASHSNDTTELVLVESRVTTHGTIGDTYNPDFGTVTASVKASKNNKSSSSSLRNPVEINAVEGKGNSVEETVKSTDGQEKESRETLIINSADTTGGLEEAEESFLSDSEFFTTANESTFLLLEHSTSTHPASDHKQKQHLIETDVHTSPRPENHNKCSINIHIRGQRAHADEVISIHKKGQRAPVEGNLQSISTQRAKREDTSPVTQKDQQVKSRKSEFSSRKYKIDGDDSNYSTTNDDNSDGSTRLFALGPEDIIFAKQESHFPNEGHHFLKENPIFPGGVSGSGQQLEKDRRKEGGVVSEGSACVGQDDNHHIVKSQEFNSSPAIIPLLCKPTTLIPAQSLSDYNNYNSNNTQQQPWRQVTSDYYYTTTRESPAEGRNITSPTSNWVCLSATTSTSDLLPRLNRGTVGFTGEEKNSVESTEDRNQSTVKTQNIDDDVVVDDTERKLRRNSSESCTTGQDQREKKRGRGNFGKCVPNELTTKKEEQLNGEDRGAEEENSRKSTHNFSEKYTQLPTEKQTDTVNANVNVASIGKQSGACWSNEPLNTADVQSKCIPEANGHNDDFVDVPGSPAIVDKVYSDHRPSSWLDVNNSSINCVHSGKLLPEKQGKSDQVFSSGNRENADLLNEDKKENKKGEEKRFVRQSVPSICEKKSEKDHSQLPSVVDTEGTLTELRDSSTPIADTLKTPVRGHSQVDRVTNQNIDSDQADYQATSLRRSNSINTIADQAVDTGELSSIQVHDPQDVGAVPITVLSSTQSCEPRGDVSALSSGQVSEPQGYQSGRKKNPQRQRIVTSSTGKRILSQNFSPASKKTKREKKNQILAENFSRSFTEESEILKQDFNSREEETDVGNEIRILTGYFKESGVKTKTGERKSILTNPTPQRVKITGGQRSKILTPVYSPVSAKTDSRKNTSRERSRILTQLQSIPIFKGKHSFNEVALKRSSDTSKTNPTSKKQGRDSEASQSDLNPSKKFKGGVTSEAGDQNKQTFPVTDGDTLNPSLQVNCSLEKNSTQSADISGCSETSDITKVFKKSSTTVFKASHNSGCGGDKIRKDTNLPNSPSLGIESCERNAATLGEVTATDAVDDISHTALPEGKGASRSKHRQITGLEGNSSVLNTKTSVTGTEVKTCDKWEDLKGVTIGTAVNEVVTLNDDYSGGGDSDINDSGIDVIRRHAYKWGALISPDSDPVKATVKPTHDTDVTFKLTATGDAGHPSNLKDVTNHLRNSPFVSQIPLGGGEKSSHNDIGGETGEIEGKSVGSCNISQNDNSLYVNTNVNSETVHYSVDKSDRNIEFTGTPSHHWRNDSLNTTAELSVNESSLGSTQKRKRKLSRRGLSNLFQRRSKKVKPCVEEAGDTVDKNIAPVIINAEKSKENCDQKIQKKVGRVTRALLPDRLKVTKHKKTTITTKESGVKKQDSYSDKHPSNPPRQSPSVNLIIKDRTNLPSNEDLRSGESHQTPKLKLKEKLTQEALETPLGDENPFLGVKNQLLSNLNINKKVLVEQEKVILQTYTVKMERQNPLLRVPNSSSPGSLGARGNPHLRNSGSQLSRNKGGSPMVSQTLPLKLASSSKISSNKTKKQKKQQQEGLNAASPLEKGQIVDNSSKEGSQEERGSRTPVLGVLSTGKDMETKGGRRKIMGLFETADKRKVPHAGETKCAKHIGDTEHSRLIPDDFDDDLIADVDGNCNVTVTGTAWNSSSIPRLNGSCLPTESTPRFNQSGKTVSHGVSTLNSKRISVKDKSEKSENLRTDYSGSYIKNNSKISLVSGDSKTDLNVGNKRVLQSPVEQNMLKFVKTNFVSNGAKANEKVSSDLMEHSAMVTESSNHIEAHSTMTRSIHDKNVHDVEHTHDSEVNINQQNDSVVDGAISQEETKEIIIETIFPSKVRDSPSPSRRQREEPTVTQVPSVVRNPKTRSASQLPMHLEKSFRTSSMRSNLKDQKSILPTHLEKTQSQSKLRKTLSRASMMKSAAKIASNKLKMENTSEGHEKGDVGESEGQVQNTYGHTVPVLDASKLSKSKLQPGGSVQKTKTSEEKSSHLPVKSPSSKVSHVTDKQPIRRSPLRQDSRGSGIQDKTKDRFGSQGSVSSDSSSKVFKTTAVSGQRSNNIVATSNSRRSMSPQSPSTSSIPRRSLSPKTTGSKMSPTRKRNDSTGSDRRGSMSSSLSKGNIEKVRSSGPDKSLATRQETKNTSPKASDSRRMAVTPSGGRGVGGMTPTQRTKQAGASGVPRTPLTFAPPPQKPTSSKPKTHCSSRKLVSPHPRATGATPVTRPSVPRGRRCQSMRETTRGSAAATPSLGSGGTRRGKDGAPQDGIPKLGSTKLPNGKVDAGGGVATSAEVQSNHKGELGNNTATTATAAAMTAKDQQLSAEPVGNVHQEENDRLRRGGMSPNQNISTTTSNASNQADQRVKVKQVQNPTVALLREENHENLQRSSNSEVGQSPAKSVSSPSLSSAAEHESKLPRFATTSGLRGSMRRNVGFASLRRDTTSPSKDGHQEVKRSGQGSVVTTTSADTCDGNLSTVTSTSTMSNNMDSSLCGRSDVVSTSSSARSSSSTSEASSGRSSTDQCRSTKLKYMSGSCSSSQLSLNSVSSEDYEGQGRRGTDSELDVAPKQYRDLRHFSGLRRNSAPPETLSDDLQQFCKKLSSEVDGSYTNAAIYANASSNDTALPHTASPVNQDTSASSQTQPTSPSLKSGLSSPRYSLIGRSTFPRSYRSASLPCIEESVILKQWEEMKGKGSEKSSSVDTLNEVSRRLSREQMTTAMFQTEDEDEVFTQVVEEKSIGSSPGDISCRDIPTSSSGRRVTGRRRTTTSIPTTIGSTRVAGNTTPTATPRGLTRQNHSDSTVYKYRRSYSLPTNSLLVTRKETSFDSDGSVKEFTRLFQVSSRGGYTSIEEEEEEDLFDEDSEEGGSSPKVNFFVGDKAESGKSSASLDFNGNNYDDLETFSSDKKTSKLISPLDINRRIILSLPNKESPAMNRLRAKREKLMRSKSNREVKSLTDSELDNRMTRLSLATQDDEVSSLLNRTRSKSFKEAQKVDVIDSNSCSSPKPTSPESRDADVDVKTGSPLSPTHLSPLPEGREQIESPVSDIIYSAGSPRIEDLIQESPVGSPKSPGIFRRMFGKSRSFQDKRRERLKNLIVDSTPRNGHKFGESLPRVSNSVPTSPSLTLLPGYSPKTSGVFSENSDELGHLSPIVTFSEEDDDIGLYPGAPRSKSMRHRRSKTIGNFNSTGTISPEIKKQIEDSLLHPPIRSHSTYGGIGGGGASSLAPVSLFEQPPRPSSPKPCVKPSEESTAISSPVVRSRRSAFGKQRGNTFDSADLGQEDTTENVGGLKRLSHDVHHLITSETTESPSRRDSSKSAADGAEEGQPRRRKSSHIPLAELEKMAAMVRQEVAASNSGSSDSGIIQDSVLSSSESLKGDDILLRESPPSTKERPKSDYLSNWTNDIWEENGPRRCMEKPRPKSDDLGGISLVSQAMKLYGGEKAEDVFEEGMRTPPLFTTSDKKKSMQEMVRPGLKSRRMSTPHPIKNRVERSPPKSRHNKRPQLVRSLSNPETIHHAGKRRKAIFAQGMAISTEAGEIALALSRTSTYSNSSNDSDTDSSSDDELHTSFRGRSSSDHSTHPALHTMEEIFEDESPIYAEALWDHVTMDEEELRFQAGDVIEVTDMSDKDWWWGIIGEREGWFPAAFVRLRANQEDTAEEYVEKMKDGNLDTRTTRRHCSFSFLSKDQARTNVVNEILSAEREYVKHLEDVIEGYVKQARKRPEMFSEERIRLIFSNMEEIYEFTSEFLEELETCYNETMPHLSEIGQCFINHSKGFEIYSDYCNNHPAACEELKEVQKNKKYKHFFEACRLLQDMIQIPLEGFLLTPVQKICKYPLQLAELLKYTRPEHRDYDTVQEALETMRKIAVLINERKRKMESVEKIAAWQRSVEDWEGPHLLETSSELIYSAEVCKVNSTGWTQDRTLFLFDHLLIYCKKDMLKRDSYSFRGRIDMDHCNVIQIEDGKDSQFNASVKNALKLHDASIDKWYLICSKTPEDRDRWLQAFREERRRVQEDQENNFVVPERMKKAAINSKHHSKQHSKRSYPEKPLEKGISRKVSRMPYPYHIEVLNNVPSHITLPRGISSHDTVSNKKRNWFPFLKGKR